MTNGPKCYEDYPLTIILASGSVSLLTYALGAYLISFFGMVSAFAYLVYCAFLEIDLFRSACVHCYYYGKNCGLGKGKLAALLFKKGNPDVFSGRKITWYSLMPNLLVLFVPLISGLTGLALAFDWGRFCALICLLLLSTLGNGFIRGELVCKFCKQKALGCPADKMIAPPPAE
jgi:hypothetical protein